MPGKGEGEGSLPRVEATIKQRHALELRLAGHTYEEIAAACGYSDHTGARKAVLSAMDKTIREPAEEVRKMELERLERLLKAWWDKAIGVNGAILDKDAADMVLKLQQRRARLLGLDAPQQIVAAVSEVPETSDMIQKMLASPKARLMACELIEESGGNEDDASGDHK